MAARSTVPFFLRLVLTVRQLWLTNVVNPAAPQLLIHRGASVLAKNEYGARSALPLETGCLYVMDVVRQQC